MRSQEILRQAELRRSLVLYRMVFGQNRQEDLIEYLRSSFSHEEIADVMEQCRIDLSPNGEENIDPDTHAY